MIQNKWRLDWNWIIPVGVVAILTPFFSQIDLSLAHFFYDAETDNALLEGIFVYGVLPAWILFIGSIIVFAGSWFVPSWQVLQRPALLLILVYALGSGLVVNVLLKDHWGRPRPRQVVEFGGTQHYRPYYRANFFHQPEPSKSFPSGHASAGFYFFALIAAGKRLQRRRWMVTGFLLAFLLGGLLSYTRIAQGGHFFSDTLFAAIVMWVVTLVCDRVLFAQKQRTNVKVIT